MLSSYMVLFNERTPRQVLMTSMLGAAYVLQSQSQKEARNKTLSRSSKAVPVWITYFETQECEIGISSNRAKGRHGELVTKPYTYRPSSPENSFYFKYS